MNQEEPRIPVVEQTVTSRRVLRFLRIVGIVVSLVLLLEFYHWLNMPAYQGKNPKQWLHLSLHSSGFADKSKESEAAIRQMGSRTVPYLLEWIAEEESPLKHRVIEWCRNSQVDWLPKPAHAIEDQARAVVGFRALGQEGKSAVPKLIRLLESSASGKDRVRFISALESIGPASHDAVPTLVHLTKQANDLELFSIARALGKIHSAPEISVPLLTNLLQHQSTLVRHAAAAGLAKFGPQAKSALPQLLKAKQDIDVNVAHAAALTLKAIDPDEAAKASIP